MGEGRRRRKTSNRLFGLKILSFHRHKGRMASPKVMNFWKSSKRPLIPPPLIFGKSCCAFFPEYMTEEAFIMAKICNINFWIGNDPTPPPPFGTFPKIHRYWYQRASLSLHTRPQNAPQNSILYSAVYCTLFIASFA